MGCGPSRSPEKIAPATRNEYKGAPDTYEQAQPLKQQVSPSPKDPVQENYAGAVKGPVRTEAAQGRSSTTGSDGRTEANEATDVLHVGWSDGLRHRERTAVSALVNTFSAGFFGGTALCPGACDGDHKHTVIFRVLSMDTLITIGMMPAETTEWSKHMGEFVSSVGLRADGVLARDTTKTLQQGTFAVGDLVRMEYCRGRLRWYHGTSQLGMLLAEAEDVPSGWHFGVSARAAQVETVESMPQLTENEQLLLKSIHETRQKVRLEPCEHRGC